MTRNEKIQAAATMAGPMLAHGFNPGTAAKLAVDTLTKIEDRIPRSTDPSELIEAAANADAGAGLDI